MKATLAEAQGRDVRSSDEFVEVLAELKPAAPPAARRTVSHVVSRVRVVRCMLWPLSGDIPAHTHTRTHARAPSVSQQSRVEACRAEQSRGRFRDFRACLRRVAHASALLCRVHRCCRQLSRGIETHALRREREARSDDDAREGGSQGALTFMCPCVQLQKRLDEALAQASQVRPRENPVSTPSVPLSTPSVPLSTPSVPSTLEYPSSSSQPRRSGPIGVCRAAPPQHGTAPFAAPSPCKMRRCDRLLAGGGLAPAGLCYTLRVAAVGERLCTDARACTAGGRNGSLLSVGGERRPLSELSCKPSLAVFA